MDINKKSGLRGRGGGGFPTGLKWEFASKNEADKKYVVCNADEGDPGAFMDRSVLEADPNAVIEGMIIAGKAINAHKGYVYCRAEYPLAISRLGIALEQAREYGLLGENILGSDFSLDLEIYQGAGAFVCGEETALMTSIEGKRGMPRPRPPFPAYQGLWKKPTVLNNVETLAYASRIIEFGEDYFLGIGTEASPGTKLISISGDVAKPGIYEIEYGVPITDILGIEMSQATSPYFVQVSGPSGECINNTEFNRRICKEDIMCGGSFMVFNRTRDILNILRNFMEFFKEESCGVCTPCRAGNFILTEKVKKIQRGLCAQEDIDEIKQWGKIIKLSSRCGLGKSSPNSLIYAVDKFKDYFNIKISPSSETQNVEFDMEDAVHEYDSYIKDTQT